MRLAVRDHRPVYQGALQLLTGPHRVEGGWWHRVVRDGEEATEHVARDYWVALEHDSIWGDHLIPLTVFVGPQMFFGQDRLDFVREALA